jgi:hypothetical protein
MTIETTQVDPPRVAAPAVDIGRRRAPPMPDRPLPVAAPAGGVMVTREKLRRELSPELADEVADALGIPPDPPKLKPWEVAYETAYAGQHTTTTHLAWQAAVGWCVGQIDKELAVFPATPVKYVREAIMGAS